MTRAEAIKIYLKSDAKEICMKCQQNILQKIDDDFAGMVEELSAQIALFYEGIAKAQKQQQKADVQYIQFSFLLSGMKQGKVEILAEAFSKEWYFGGGIYEMYFSMDWLEKELHELQEILNKKSKRFLGKVTEADVERILLHEWRFYQKIEESLLKYALELSLDEKALEEIKKEEDVHIFAGEYRGEFHQIYTINGTSKQLREVLYGLLFNRTI
ncbi:MAG TPA: hypothetical protein IAB62_05335 [Candidatus Coprocola pullicola]|nr:hypothetical protein [Candidatus Coprocola pullicola]